MDIDFKYHLENTSHFVDVSREKFTLRFTEWHSRIARLLQYQRLRLKPAWIIDIMHYKYGLKLLIHVISFQTLLGLWTHIHAGIKINPC